jgi:hypothetical protein
VKLKTKKDPRWTHDTIYEHDAGLDAKIDGNCPRMIALIIIRSADSELAQNGGEVPKRTSGPH